MVCREVSAPRLSQVPVCLRAEAGAGADHQVRAKQRLGLFLDRAPQAGAEGAQGYQRRDAEHHAQGKQQQAAPGSPRVPPGHAQDEDHAGARPNRPGDLPEAPSTWLPRSTFRMDRELLLARIRLYASPTITMQLSRRFGLTVLLCLGWLLGGAASARPQPAATQPKTVVFFGDSLTYGLGLEDPATEAYPALIGQKIAAAHLPWQVVNAGLSGDTTAARLAADRLGPAPPHRPFRPRPRRQRRSARDRSGGHPGQLARHHRPRPGAGP